MNADDPVNLKALEKELHEAVQADRLYWQRNDAKIRAATDANVKSYEEFEEIVAAAHLRPLDKSERLESAVSKRGVVWNPTCIRQSPTDRMEASFRQELDCRDDVDPDDPAAWTTSLDVSRRLRYSLGRGGPEAGFAALREAGVSTLGRALLPDLPPTLLSDVLRAVGAFDTADVAQVAFAVEILQALVVCSRFNLTLDFLSCEERSRSRTLFKRLRGCLKGGRRQDLAELGVTEWTLESLAKTYRVSETNNGNIAASRSPSRSRNSCL